MSVTALPDPIPEPMTRRQHMQATRAELARRFPKAFLPEGGLPKWPLKVGILADVFEYCPDISRRRLRHAIENYTAGVTYQRAIVFGAVRVDLFGRAAGTVTRNQQAQAERQLAETEARKAAKRRIQAEREQNLTEAAE